MNIESKVNRKARVVVARLGSIPQLDALLHLWAWSLFVALLLMILGCERRDGTMGASAGELIDSVEAYQGSVVTVSGEIGEVLSPRVFTIGAEDMDREVLILSSDEIATPRGRTGGDPLRKRDIVQVTGTVYAFDRETLANYGVDAEQLSGRFEGSPVIVTQSGAGAARMTNVIVTPRTGEDDEGAVAGEEITDLRLLSSEDSDDLWGHPARFSNVSIRAVADEDAAWITDGTGDVELFAVLAPGAIASDSLMAAPDGRWNFYGVLLEMPSERTLTSRWDFDDETTDRLREDDIYLHVLEARPAAR